MQGWLEVFVLGLLQGLTEFLPVSSSGHLAVGQLMLGLREGNLALSVTLHAGTLLATLLYFRRRIGLIVYDLVEHWSRPGVAFSRPAGADAKVILIASIPTAVIGLLLEARVAAWTTDPLIVGLGFLVTAALLTSTWWTRPGEHDLPSTSGALLLGLAQGIAVLPGISRSGATIVTLLLLGVRSSRAFELSMLISLPAVTGAFLLELLKGVGDVRPPGELVFGALVACVVGLGALHALGALVTRGRLGWFALWVLPLAVGLFILPGSS